MAWAWDVMMSWTLDPSLGLEHGRLILMHKFAYRENISED
jgi:hypothetical protein